MDSGLNLSFKLEIFLHEKYPRWLTSCNTARSSELVVVEINFNTCENIYLFLLLTNIQEPCFIITESVEALETGLYISVVNSLNLSRTWANIYNSTESVVSDLSLLRTIPETVHILCFSFDYQPLEKNHQTSNPWCKILLFCMLTCWVDKVFTVPACPLLLHFWFRKCQKRKTLSFDLSKLR